MQNDGISKRSIQRRDEYDNDQNIQEQKKSKQVSGSAYNDGHYHNSLKQYMFWSKNPDGAVLSDPIKNVTGDRKLHRWRKENLNMLLEDYELVEG